MEKSPNRAVSLIWKCAGKPCITAAFLCLVPGILLLKVPSGGTAWGFVGCGFVLLAVWLYLTLRRKLPMWGSGVLWWGIGYCLRFAYILRFPYYQMQHDVNRFTSENGHAAYIWYLFTKGYLPDMDVRTVWQFYHPPLHHTLCAAWMRLLTALGLPEAQVFEGVQLLPLCYSCLALAVFGLLLRELGLKGAAFTLPMSVMAVHPIFIILAGSINNDMLSILFMLTALLLAIRWYRTPRMRTILGLALAIGLGMMAKLSAYMTAPAVAVLFLMMLWKQRRKPLRLIGQFAAFGAVCVPLGLGWEIRNLVTWGVPLTYIPRLSEKSGQYVGNIPVLQRLFDFSPHQFTYIYDCYTQYGQAYNEYNPLIGLMKTAVFDEFLNTDRFPSLHGFGEVLFWSQILLAAGALYALVWVLRHCETPLRAALCITYGVVLANYFVFCFTHPHTCTQSMRYATPVIYTSLACLGLRMQGSTGGKAETAAGQLLTAVTMVFVLTSFLVFGLVVR